MANAADFSPEYCIIFPRWLRNRSEGGIAQSCHAETDDRGRREIFGSGTFALVSSVQSGGLDFRNDFRRILNYDMRGEVIAIINYFPTMVIVSR